VAGPGGSALQSLERRCTIRHSRIFDTAARLYDLATDQPFWREAIGRMLDAAGPLPPAPRVLDLGCGPGHGAFVMAARLGPSATVLGIDAAPRMIAVARRHLARRHPDLANVRFEVADAARLDLSGASIDLAAGHSFLYIVPDPAAVLAEVRRVLAPGGTLVLMEPDAAGTLLRAARRLPIEGRDWVRRPWAAARFAGSMVTWRVYSRGRGQLDASRVERLMRDAGFRDVSFAPTLGGLGMHCVART